MNYNIGQSNAFSSEVNIKPGKLGCIEITSRLYSIAMDPNTKLELRGLVNEFYEYKHYILEQYDTVMRVYRTGAFNDTVLRSSDAIWFESCKLLSAIDLEYGRGSKQFKELLHLTSTL